MSAVYRFVLISILALGVALLFAPRAPAPDVGDGGLPNTQTKGDVRLALNPSEAPNLFNLNSGELRVPVTLPWHSVDVWLAAIVAVSVQMILATCRPFEIARRRVRAVAVNMVHLCSSIHRRFQERERYQPMHSEVLAASRLIERNHEVSAAIKPLFENVTRPSMRPALNATYLTMRTDLVLSLVARYWTPFITHTVIISPRADRI